MENPISPNIIILVMEDFYTFEGIDGSGKTSIMQRTAEFLREGGKEVETTMEPTGTWLGQAVERSYGEDVSPFTEAFLFMADRATHCQQIERWLKEGKLVLSDRFSHSTYAYQGAALAGILGGGEAAMDFLIKGHEPFVLEPAKVFLFDIDPKLGLERATGRGELSKFEKLEYLSMVRDNYLVLAKRYGFTVIDASQTFDEVLEEVMKNFI